MLVRSKRREGIRRRNQGFAGRGQDKGANTRADRAPAEAPTGAHPTTRGETRRATATQPGVTAIAPRPADRRRELGPAQDQATYSCSCGYVFEASVSTSVGCPHCGATQAW